MMREANVMKSLGIGFEEMDEVWFNVYG